MRRKPRGSARGQERDRSLAKAHDLLLSKLMSGELTM